MPAVVVSNIVVVYRMPRFKPGDNVRVVSSGSRFFKVHGVFDQVIPNTRNLTQLDSYTVRFSWGEKSTFWDAELEFADSQSNVPPTRRQN